jgi:probable F420-dependent oxidoreductase
MWPVSFGAVRCDDDWSAMRLGAVFPQSEIGSNPADIRAWAQAVEELGYQHLLAYDHVLGAGTDTRPGWRGYTSDTAFHEVFVLFGYLAAVTTELELVTGVVILPQRQTALVAKQAAEVDVLSQGRLRLGVGVGWNPVEYEALGESFTDRGRRSVEQIEVMRALWADSKVTYEGRWHRVDNAGINPLPPRGHIPVWLGGTADVLLRRVGEIGDGWFPQGPPDDGSRAALDVIRRSAEAAGRDADKIGIEPRLSLGQVEQAQWAEYVAGWAGIGATHLCVNTMGLGLTSADQHISALREAMAIIR